MVLMSGVSIVFVQSIYLDPRTNSYQTNLPGTNNWIHDVEVTNRDECVCVKSPSSNIMVERVWCNQSGASSIGSLGAGVAVEDIYYRDVYTNGGNQIFLIKSWGGSGYAKNILLENFLSHNTAYGLDVDQYWSGMTQADGAGVQLSNITFRVQLLIFSRLRIKSNDFVGLGGCGCRWCQATPDSVHML